MLIEKVNKFSYRLCRPLETKFFSFIPTSYPDKILVRSKISKLKGYKNVEQLKIFALCLNKEESWKLIYWIEKYQSLSRSYEIKKEKRSA